jgi:nucleoside-diphosphate-sugar epimerase
MLISVLGCGWLGLPLAEALVAKGFEVKGSVTSFAKHELMRQRGIRPYRLVLETDHIEMDDADFFNTDLIIVSIPPRRADDVERIFPAQIGQLIRFLKEYRVPRVLFISSTSVYPEISGIVKEDDAVTPDKVSGRALLEAEKLLIRDHAFKTTIIRFGGLIGADRNPARFLTRRKEVFDGSKPVNLIHRDDCIQIILELIGQEVWGEVFNACCPVHPTRKEFYEKASEVSGIPAPLFDDGPLLSWKKVDTTKLIERLKYRFKYPDPTEWLTKK